MRVFIAVPLLLAVVPVARAQAPAYDWRPVNHETASMLRAGNYDLAAPYVENGLASCPQAINPREAALCTAIFQENRSTILEHKGDLAGAEAARKAFLEARQSVLPPLDPMIQEAHYWNALFYQRHQQYDQEAAELAAAEAIARAGGPPHRAEVIGFVARRAQALTAMGRPADALPLYQDAYTASQALYAPGSAQVLMALSNLFKGLTDAGFPQNAIALADAALASADAVSSFDPTQRAFLAGQLALATVTLTQSKAALTYAQAALPAVEQGGVTNPDARYILLRGLARVSTGTGDADRAVDLARQARALAAATWGATSIAVANALTTEADAEAVRHNVPAALDRLNEASAILADPPRILLLAQLEVQRGGLLLRAGRSAEAIASHLALAASPNLGAAETATKAAVLSLLGEDLITLSAYDAAAPLCRQAADFAADAPALAPSYVIKAQLCSGNAALAQGRPADALLAGDRARTALWTNSVRQAAVEPNLLDQRAILQLRGRALIDSGRNDEALGLLQERQALDHRRGDAGAEAEAWADIAMVQRKMRRFDESRASAANGLALLGSDGDPRRRANLLENDALMAISTGHAEAAIPLFEQVLALRRTDPVPETLSIGTSERDYASALAKVGRNQDAARHLDVAIDLFRELGQIRRAYLLWALNWRVTLATSLGDLPRAEAATRELIALYDPSSGEGAGARLVLANQMDGQARRTEADALRAEAVSAMTARFGAGSAVVMRTRLAALPWLRAQGRMTDAEATVRDCLTLADTASELTVPCLMAQAEAALQAGNNRTAAEVSARAVTAVEAHWERDGGMLRDTLNLQARSAAALGDVSGLIRLYDRIRELAARQGTSAGWINLAYAQLLIQAGEPAAALPALRKVLDDAAKAHEADLAIAATASLAAHLNGIGAGSQALALWAPVQALLDDSAPGRRVEMLSGLGLAHFGLARDQDAANDFEQAAALSRTIYGHGTPIWLNLVIDQAAALARNGQGARAEDTLRQLDGDQSPAAALARTRGLMQLARASDDPVAYLQLARTALEQVRAMYGEGSVNEAFAGLDLAEARLQSGGHVDPNDISDSVGIIQAQQPGWQASLRINRVLAMMALTVNRYDEASGLLMTCESLLTAHAGADSLDVAIERSDRAAVRLQAGDAGGADVLFRQALDIAAPGGDWHNAVWAQIAPAAAIAAERVGDIARSIQLRRDANAILPAAASRETRRWL